MFSASPHIHSMMSTGPINMCTTSGDWPTRDQELLTVQATLRRLQLTPEEAIKIVSAHIQELKSEVGQT